VLGQCRELAHLNLGHNQIGPAWAESLAGGLAQCPVLDQLYLGYNDIGTVGKGRLRASWYGRASALWLEDEEDVEEEEEKE
jgi:Ran GTPase-activating protein (RanGAP) involved in mRNA processing and transport